MSALVFSSENLVWFIHFLSLHNLNPTPTFHPMFEEENENPDRLDFRKMPLFQKGWEIGTFVRKMVELIPPENEQLMEVGRWMEADAAILCAKVANASGGGFYDMQMENAAIIRKSARELVVQCHSLQMFGFEHEEYFQVIRDLVEEYRLLFLPWVASFDQWDYIIDRWGVFNPPGVGPNDKDPDDDIPFNPEDFE